MKRITLLLAGFLVLAGGGILVWTFIVPRPLEGRWVREEVTMCSITYPSALRFFDDGTYFTEGPSLWWRGGSYKLKDHVIRLDTTTGSDLYDVEVTSRRVVFTNINGCSIAYTKAD